MSKNLLTKVVNENTFRLLFFIVFVGVTFGQNGLAVSDSQPSKVNADQIIERAKALFFKNAKIEDLKQLSLEFDSTEVIPSRNGKKRQIKTGTKLFVAFPNKIRYEKYRDFTTNQQLLTQILNLNQYSQTSDLFVDGKPFNPVLNIKGILPKTTNEQRSAGFKGSIFSTIFPVILQSSWYDELEFKFIGEAESKDGKADVIEATDKNNTKYRVFFDNNSHLPVMMTQNLMHPLTNKEIEKKSYYSDYREANGLLIAHKVVIQLGNEVIEERQLKKLQINPTFKSNLFEIDKNKSNVFDN